MEIIKEPQLDYLGTVANSPQWTFPLHEHCNHCELVIILNGKGRMIINDKIHYVERGDVIIYNSKTLHEEFSNAQSPIEFIYFGIRSLKIKELEDNTILPIKCNPKMNMGKYFPTIETLVSLIYKEFSDKKEGFESICSAQLSTIIHLIHRVSFRNERKNKFEPINSQLIKKYLDENYKKELQLKDIAKEFNISTYYLSHLFFESYQVSPINYINNRRIGEAKLLLLNTNKKIKEIANLLGYTDENYFSHFFKNKTGESPLNYKKNELTRRISN
ncbi:AraC family transcriptional regulator [Tetragenococcus koreensis]|uniref:AraC family transcriptional regulator n=1 Tax=Tetragenococcus koreensis TaxID=290335 RepID=UPI000F4E54AA|nr:AraC family transcriptional regulator [Tetragenococcus koreensis]AYW46731.1 hypothetical protein C7K43_12860 [Tetragenococcus koreensis]GEN91620.1 AraC family transcriptional regulator [Tetragenococcus koreensis]